MSDPQYIYNRGRVGEAAPTSVADSSWAGLRVNGRGGPTCIGEEWQNATRIGGQHI